MLCIRCFGGFEVIIDGESLAGPWKRKTDKLLAFLLLKRGHAISSEELIETFWSAADDELEEDAVWNSPSRAHNSLSKSRGELKRILKEEGCRLFSGHKEVGFLLDGVDVDLFNFDRAINKNNPEITELKLACSLYQGNAETVLFRGWDDAWIVESREKCTIQRIKALRLIAVHETDNQNYRAAAEYLKAAVLSDPELAEGWRDQMEAWINAGEQLKAIHVYSDYRTRLKKIGLEPPPEMTRWYDEITRKKRLLECPEYARPGGGELPTSEFYIERPADIEFHAALERKDSIILVKGPRQVGKTSLLARGIRQAREAKWKVVITDFQAIDAAEFATSESLYMAMAQTLADQLDLDKSLVESWKASLTANFNFERYLRREVLTCTGGPLIWVMDEVDRLFHCDFKDDVFGLFRSWHNKRALDAGGPWSQLTLAMAYATEAHLLISDLNQSPFNVGTRLTLSDFTREQVETLNTRYKSPLQDASEMIRFFNLVGGHAYLVRCGLYEIAAHHKQIADIEAEANHDEGIFGDHLARVLKTLMQEDELVSVVQKMLRGEPCPAADSFYRLRSAGIIRGESPANAQFRCGLYASYLKRHLT